MNAEEALAEIIKFDCAVNIRKLSRSTIIKDCEVGLREFLGLTESQLRPLYSKYLQVSDFPFDVWLCEVSIPRSPLKHRRAYGKTFVEAVERAVKPRPYTQRGAV